MKLLHTLFFKTNIITGIKDKNYGFLNHILYGRGLGGCCGFSPLQKKLKATHT